MNTMGVIIMGPGAGAIIMGIIPGAMGIMGIIGIIMGAMAFRARPAAAAKQEAKLSTEIYAITRACRKVRLSGMASITSHVQYGARYMRSIRDPVNQLDLASKNACGDLA